jgi:CHAT domain-containing protein
LSPGFRTAVLQNLGSVCEELGMRGSAMEYLRRAERLAVEHELREWLFDVRHSMSSIALARSLDGELRPSEALAIARDALAVAYGPEEVAIGELRVAELTPGDEGLSLMRELARASDGESFGGFEAPTALGLRLLSEGRAQEALAPLESALASTQRGGFARNVVRGLVNLSRARLELGPRDEALETALRAMDAVERLHDTQTGETVGALNFSTYSPIYYLTLGKLLAAEDRSYEDVELAFGISERMRSRFLIEHLDRAGGGDGSGASPERTEVLRGISELQTRLLLSETKGDDRATIERQLERLEEEEVLLRAAQDRNAPARDVGEDVSLQAIQRELRGDEALISFLLASPQQGGSWVVTVTSTEARVDPLPERRKLETAVGFWIGLLQRADGSEREAAARLYADLLEPLMRDLPPGVRRLTIIPDGPLHRIPFDALRPNADAPPLLARFEVTHVPSAHVWMRLREASPGGEPDALLLADHEFSEATLRHATLRSFRLADIEIGGLPFAREEAAHAARSLGRADLRVGLRANEAFLKQADLGAYRVLHFATHALIDEDRPDRSAILLAPGDDIEDGLLQAREVLDFELRGAMVTLSACQSAGGRVLAGEGVMGLARSFFQARASVVVGGLWPLRDEVTARLMTEFYEGLGRGLPVGEAMARAKREMHRAGLPPAAWAGLVVLGDGAHAPWPDGRRARLFSGRIRIAGWVLLALLLAFLALRRRFRLSR